MKVHRNAQFNRFQILFVHTGISNIEIIRNIKKDCESSEHHVLCPKTFACIAKDFLCDGDNGKSISQIF